MNNESKEQTIARRIYDLDEKVYKSLKSTLGRVFTEDRAICVQQIAQNISRRKIHVVRSEMALILNMIHTVEDTRLLNELQQEYNETKKMLDELPDEYISADIINADLSELKQFHRPKDQNLIICIGREFGSAGTEIGFELANRLNLEFYDREIFKMVLERLDAEKENIEDALEDQVPTKKTSLFHDFSKYHGLSREDAFFFNQSDLIVKLAKEKSFIIVGRCADVILTQHMIPHYSIFIEAPFDLRVKRTMAMKNLTYKEAVRFVKSQDHYHKKYYNFYTGRKWGNATNYDLCLNSATYGIDGTVNIIERMLVES